MKIQILSDLHNEMGVYQTKKLDVDVVVLAGDIDLGTKGVEWAIEAFKGTPVVYVAGNHEYWYENINKLDTALSKTADGTNVFVLKNSDPMVEIEDCLFLGGTFWTDYCLEGEAREPMVKLQVKNMRDFQRISYGRENKKVTPDVLQSIHYGLKEQMNYFLHGHSDLHKKIVMVTHHAPHPRSLSPLYRDDYSNPCYASDCSSLLFNMPGYRAPKLWIHGHIHTNNDYMMGDTRIVSNPRGYEGVLINSYFKDDLVIEV